MEPKQILIFVFTFLAAVYVTGIVVRRVCGQCSIWKRRITWILVFIMVNWGVHFATNFVSGVVSSKSGAAKATGAKKQQQQQQQQQQ